MITLTAPFALANGTRLVATMAKPDDDEQVFTITYELRTAPATDIVLASQTIRVRNTRSERLQRNASATGIAARDLIQVDPNGISTPTGYTDAIAAWRAAATPATRRAALDAVGLSAGWIDSSLTGT